MTTMVLQHRLLSICLRDYQYSLLTTTFANIGIYEKLNNSASFIITLTQRQQHFFIQLMYTNVRMRPDEVRECRQRSEPGSREEDCYDPHLFPTLINVIPLLQSVKSRSYHFWLKLNFCKTLFPQSSISGEKKNLPSYCQL